MSYPTTITPFVYKRNLVDKVIADDVNLAYTDIMEIERQLGEGGVTVSTWGTGTFATTTSNWYSAGGLKSRLQNIEAGLYATLVTGSASAAKLKTAVTVNGTTGVDWSASSYTFTADATTLTGTSLKSTVLGSSLTSVGTLGNLVIAASAGTTAPLKLTAGTNIGTVAAGAVEYDGKALYYTQSATTGRAVVQATNYYTYYGNSANLGGSTLGDGGYQSLTLAPYTAYEFEGMYAFTFNTVADGVTPVSSYPRFQISGTATVANSSISVVYWCATGATLSATNVARTIYETYTVGGGDIPLENTTSNTSARAGIVKWKGIVRNQQSGTGTLYARVWPSAQAANVSIKDGSYVKVTPIGPDYIDVNGAWT
jgi:hypothetical protein